MVTPLAPDGEPERSRTIGGVPGPAVAAILVVIALVIGAGVYAFAGRDDVEPQASTTPSAVVTPTAPPTTTGPSSPPTGATAGGPPVTGVPYCTNAGQELLLDFFPAPSTEPAPLIVYVHGGGWTRGDRTEIERVTAFESLVAAGYSIASIDYRLAPANPFPASIEDVKCAIRYLRVNAASYGVDPDRIALMGFSAGAHLALLAGFADASAGFDTGQYSEVSSDVRAVIEFSGQVDVTDLQTVHPDIAAEAFSGDLELMTRASPITYLDSDDPPVLVFHGDADKTVPVDQAALIDERLTEAGVEHTVVIIPGGEHQPPKDRALTATMLDFLGLYVA